MAATTSRSRARVRGGSPRRRRRRVTRRRRARAGPQPWFRRRASLRRRPVRRARRRARRDRRGRGRPPRRRRRRRGSRGTDRARWRRRGCRGGRAPPRSSPRRPRVIAKPSDRALARSIVAPSTRTSRASPRAPRIARATTHPEAEACVARRWASAATKDAWSGGTPARARPRARRAPPSPSCLPSAPSRATTEGRRGRSDDAHALVPSEDVCTSGTCSRCSRRCPDENDSVVSRARAALRDTPRTATAETAGRRRASFPDHAPASRFAPTRARPRAWRVTQMPRHQPTITPAGRLVSTRGRCHSLRASPVAARAAMATRRIVPRPALRCSPARVHDSSASTPSEPALPPRASPDLCKGGGGPSDGFPETDSTALALLPRSTPLTPLMDRLRTPKRVFAYPDLNVELTITQGWDESGAGTGAAVWDSAERLARCVAETGALSALRQHPTAALRVRDVDDARAWWRGKTVVELGAGLGLTSLVAASAGASRCAPTATIASCACARKTRAQTRRTCGARAPRTNARRRETLASRLTPRDSCGATRMMRVPPRIGFEPRMRRARSRRSKARSRRSKAVRVRVRLRRRRIPRSSYWRTWCTVNGRRVGGRWWGRFDAWRGRRRSWRCRTRRGNGASDAFFDMAKDAGFQVRRAERWVENRDGATSVTSLYAMFLEEG